MPKKSIARVFSIIKIKGDVEAVKESEKHIVSIIQQSRWNGDSVPNENIVVIKTLGELPFVLLQELSLCLPNVEFVLWTYDLRNYETLCRLIFFNGAVRYNECMDNWNLSSLKRWAVVSKY